ncbi:MAG: amidophosphoribosyltransferase, partial [Kiritimatiellae bacterium]|nr:amidophosphoribosyltransferase [Kiritimatiellia bacterium]
MSDEIKHECAVALLRLRDGAGEGGPLAGSSDPGGTALSLLLEKQHNRGQDGAGAAVLSLDPEPGSPAWWLSKSASSTALADLLAAIGRRPRPRREAVFLGHLRYATYGRGDESFCHPFVHASPRLDRTLFLAGNFNLTNTHELFDEFRNAGNHPGSTADGYLICELLAAELEDCSQISNVHNCPQIAKPNDGALGERALPTQTPRTPRTPREKETPRTPREDNEPTILRALRTVLPKLDGAFTLCGMTGDGWAFAVRDAHGIRPGCFHVSPRAVAVASERPAIQAALDCPTDAVRELPPGEALLVSPAGEVRFERVLEPAEPRPCVFERIYFSRANDADIHRERKALGAALAPPLLRAVDFDLDHTFFSYIPNSAQVAFHGLLEALWTEGLAEGRPVRFGQVAVKDAKFRTFIADAAARREIGKHVYDVTYGLVRPGVDTLVVLDDSIVRGTTMRDAILPMLDRLGPKRIVVASSAPPIRYPDCYGIDMSTLGELVAFRALENLLG